jgi:hypothetical protein
MSCLAKVMNRTNTVGRLSWLVVAFCLAHASSVVAELPTNNEPARQIRFNTASEADARRAKLINYIWDSGLPATLPGVASDVAFPDQSVGIDPLNVARVDRITSNVSDWDFESVSYLMHPKNTANANRLVVVSQGHADDLMSGVGATANHLLQNGFTVLVVKMPLYGWNTDRTATIPGQGEVTYASHDELIANTSPKDGGRGYRLFLEPIVQGINHVAATNRDLADVGMVGLSGGGWATSMMAAIDTRIKTSIPIAGSTPLYIRNIDSSSVGDLEQFYSPLFDESIRPDGSGGGVATWLEIYALGGYGKGRRQIMVTNEFDTCCFAGTHADSYATLVTEKVAALQAGQWKYVRDSTHHTHQISSHILATVINPAFGMSSPAPAPRKFPQRFEFDGASGGVPAGWSIDPSSGRGSAAVENDGKVTIEGGGLASIVLSAPLDLQNGQVVTIKVAIERMTADNFMGVFLADNIGSRAFHVGPIFNGANKKFGLNADNGEGFNTKTDRAMLKTISDYSGGKAEMSMSFDAGGFTLQFAPEGGPKYSSGRQPWSRVPGGFDPARLGHYAQLYIQSFDTDGGDKAKVVVDRVVVTESIGGDDDQTDSESLRLFDAKLSK